MEDIHDFIQWLFPLPEPSRFNPDAPLLSAEDIEEFHRDPQLRANLLRSLDRFLGFLGLQRVDRGVIAGANFASKRSIWLYPNHNWLRITRALRCLRRLGLAEEGRAFFARLKSLYEGNETGIRRDTFRYWQEAVQGEVS